jgi:hypothetical protein
MTALSPLDAAIEGIQVMRREPKAVLVWGLLWLVWFSIAAAAITSSRKVVVSHTISHLTSWEIFQHYGPFAVVVVGLFFLVWGITAIAAFRAVLQPEERRFFYLRLGRDELRVAAISLAAFSLVAIFGGAPGFLLIALASPIMAAVPALAREIGELGAWVTVCLEVWLCVRLSLIAVETFAEHRFHLTAYWPLTQGRFWYLFFSYCIIFVIFFAVTILYLAMSGALSSVALAIFTEKDLVRRTSVLVIAGILTILTAGYSLLTSVLFCACQARAYQAISAHGPWE